MTAKGRRVNTPNGFPQGYLVQADENGKVQFVYQPMPWRLEIAAQIYASEFGSVGSSGIVDAVIKDCFVVADKLIAEHERTMGGGK
jgi:hypothetical protein